jgi:hypothetical protein
MADGSFRRIADFFTKKQIKVLCELAHKLFARPVQIFKWKGVRAKGIRAENGPVSAALLLDCHS